MNRANVKAHSNSHITILKIQTILLTIISSNMITSSLLTFWFGNYAGTYIDLNSNSSLSVFKYSIIDILPNCF